jgi:glutathione S-transferase
MLKVHHAPFTRSIRVLWLLEELGLPYEVARVDFQMLPGKFFAQATPTGKLPVLEDGDVVIGESTAILEYVLERYGNGRLAPAPGAPGRAELLQWIHFSEATAMPPIAHLLWMKRAAGGADLGNLAVDAQARIDATLDVLEKALDGKDFLVRNEFSAADVAIGIAVFFAKRFEMLGEGRPRIAAYLDRLTKRPAFERAVAVP